MTALTAAAALGGAVHGDDAPRVAFVQVASTADRPATDDIGGTLLGGRYRAGMRIVVAPLDEIDTARRVIADGFACATDPVLTDGGDRLLFAGARAPGEPLQIWETSVADGGPTRVLECAADCVAPVPMPSGHVVFASTLAGEYEEHGGQRSLSLYEWAPGTEDPVRITFNPSSDFDPAVLPDGRIAYSAWQHVGRHHWPRGTIALLLVNSDGTGIFPLTGNHRGPWLKRATTPVGDDRIAFVASEGLVHFGAGTLLVTSLNDAFAPYAPLLDGDGYEVEGVAALPDGRLVVSALPRDGSRPTFGLYLCGEDGALAPLYDDPDAHDLAPTVAPTGPAPDRRVSTVVPGTAWGYLLVLDCTETDRTDQHPVRRDAVAAVRVIEGTPLRRDDGRDPAFAAVPGRGDEPLVHRGAATGAIPARILGEVPPAPDGSLYLKVPADRPLRLQLLDRDGFTLMDERAWFWVRPNERRVCIGCHENRELAPPNRTPLAARDDPVDLTNADTARTISFRDDIEPMLHSGCALAGCHVPPTPTAGMNLGPAPLARGGDAVLADRFGPAYANLLRRQDGKPFAVGGRLVHPGDSKRSPLLWMLHGRALAPQYRPAPFERPMISPHPGPMLSDDRLRLLRAWIDLGATYDAGAGPDDDASTPIACLKTGGSSDEK
jgi:hypothetical protein